MGKYYGKYRGEVVMNIDPEMRGRLSLKVDGLSIIAGTWAEPCAPLSGTIGAAMGVYMIPPVGAGVWVEFEGGDINKPIWVGCRWDTPSDVPPLAHAGVPASPNIVMQTSLKNALILSDLPGPTGGIMIKSASGASIIVNDTGIYIQNGKGAKIDLIGPAITISGTPVDINNGALTML